MVMGEPPVRGAIQLTTDCVMPPLVPATPVGAPGAPSVIELEAAEAGPVPLVLVAVTVNVYTVLAVSPEIVQVVVPDEHVMPPGLDVTV